MGNCLFWFCGCPYFFAWFYQISANFYYLFCHLGMGMLLPKNKKNHCYSPLGSFAETLIQDKNEKKKPTSKLCSMHSPYFNVVIVLAKSIGNYNFATSFPPHICMMPMFPMMWRLNQMQSTLSIWNPPYL